MENLRSSRRFKPPLLTHLTLPLFEDSTLDYGNWGQLYPELKVLSAFLERYRESLLYFRLLNAAEDRCIASTLESYLRGWLSIEELRFGSACIDRHDLRRVRIDRFDLEDIEGGFTDPKCFERVKVLVLNTLLPLEYVLKPDPNEFQSPLLREMDRRRVIVQEYSSSSQETPEKSHRTESCLQNGEEHTCYLCQGFWILGSASSRDDLVFEGSS